MPAVDGGGDAGEGGEEGDGDSEPDDDVVGPEPAVFHRGRRIVRAGRGVVVQVATEEEVDGLGVAEHGSPGCGAEPLSVG